MARRVGIGIRDLTMYPFWGVARWTCQGERPRQDKFIAASGLTSLAALSLLLSIAFELSSLSISFPSDSPITSGTFAAYLFWASLALIGLHLLPLLPLDCGQLFRGVLAMRMSRIYATEAAAAVTTVGSGSCSLSRSRRSSRRCSESPRSYSTSPLNRDSVRCESSRASGNAPRTHRTARRRSLRSIKWRQSTARPMNRISPASSGSQQRDFGWNGRAWQ